MKSRSRWVAGFLSLISSFGLAQLYNGQSFSAVVFFAAFWLIVSIATCTGLMVTIYGCVAGVVASLLLIIASIVNAIKNSGKLIQLKWYNRWYVYLLFYVVTICAYAFVKPFAVTEAFKIPSAAMYPTIRIGDRVMVDKRGANRRDIRAGDVIVFKGPDSSKSFLKRVVGLGGDRVRTQGTELYINDKKIPHSDLKTEGDTSIMSEELGQHRFSVQYMPYHSYSDQEYIVPEGQLFVMGDNRDNSADSREYGFVPVSNVVGKVAFIYWSSDRNRLGQSFVTH